MNELTIDWSYIAGAAMIAYVAYEVLFSDVGLTRSHAEVVAIRRAKNLKRGITMTPGFTYLDPDGTRCMSPTGRAKDCSCGGTHISHRGNV